MRTMKHRTARWAAFEKEYRRGLEDHVGRKDDDGAAGRMGRRAHGLGIGALALARIHDRALGDLAPPRAGRRSAAAHDLDLRATAFFSGAIANDGRASPRRGAASLADTHDRCAAALVRSQDRLERETERCELLKAALAASEDRHETLLARSRLIEERLRQLSRRLLSAQEEERLRISRDLHDAVGQALTGINVGLATLRNEALTDSKEITESIAMTQRLVERSMETVHEFARELRPTLLDDLGLIPALRSHANAFSQRNGLRLRFAAAPVADQMDADRRTALFRVAQEALNNVARHAQAHEVRVSLRRVRAGVRLKIKDDGRSFDVARMERSTKNRHLGLLGMQERMEMVGGTLSIKSVPGRGTTILADAPVPRGART
jgi:signal transduction histidine kinase